MSQKLKKIKLANRTLATFAHFFANRINVTNRNDSKLVKKLNEAITKPLEAYALSRDTIIKDMESKEWDDVRDMEPAKQEKLKEVGDQETEFTVGKTVYDFIQYRIDEIVYSYKNRDGGDGIQGTLDNAEICDMFEALDGAEEA